MKRTLGVLLVSAALGGCMTANHGGPPPVGCGGFGGGGFAAQAPGVQGPWGTPVAMAAPYSSSPPDAALARAMMSQSVPLNLVQASYSPGANAASGVIQAGGSCPARWLRTRDDAAGRRTSPAGASRFANDAGAGHDAGARRHSRCRRSHSIRHAIALSHEPHVGAIRRPSGHEDILVRTWGRVQGRLHRYSVDRSGPLQLRAGGGIYRLKLSDIPNRPGLELYPSSR